MVENGKLIVLEAVDDITLAQVSGELCRWLRARGLAVEETRQPTYGPAGSLILQDRQGRLQFDAASLALLYLADRLDHAQRVDGIDSSLAAGRHVICMHYGLAAAARLWGQVEWDWLCQIDALCRVPDLTLFLDFEAHGSPQEHLRESYLAAIERLQGNGRALSIVDGIHTPESIGLACKRDIARLLEFEQSGFHQGVYGQNVS